MRHTRAVWLQLSSAGGMSSPCLATCTHLATLTRLCAEQALRVTEQRRIILQLIAEAHDYPDIEELHRRAVRLDPRISLATIYRNVRAGKRGDRRRRLRCRWNYASRLR